MLDQDFLKHIKALGLENAAEYVRWCKKHGFSTGIFKNLEQRNKELQFLKDEKIKAAFQKGKEKFKPTSVKLKQALSSSDGNILDPQIQKVIKELSIASKQIPEFLTFLQIISQKSKLIDTRTTKFIPSYKDGLENSPLYALGKIFKHKSSTIRPMTEWECETKNLYRQMSSLLRHLFTPYKMPTFLDSAWFSKDENLVNWFLFIAQGKNIRKAENLPIVLSKMQAHYFLQAPEHYSVMQALRYGQIMGMCEDKRLVEVVLQKEFGSTFAQEEFWFEVIRLFMNNPMLDRSQFGSVCDYIQAIKFNPQAPHPGFSMKGRTAQTLMNQVDEWHSKISKERGKNYLDWKPCGTNGFMKEEKLKDGKQNWTINELLNSILLGEESRDLNHCVSSYRWSCHNGKCSIWSLKLDKQRCLTIEINISSQTIVQVRGKNNRLTNSKEAQIIREWAQQESLGINCLGF